MFASPFLLAPAALVVGGLASEATLARRDQRRFPCPGQRVDLGGHGLHARVLGTGDPVIVLEAGSGEWSTHWGRLPEELSRLSTVVAYDRAGLGWSAAGPGTRDAETAAQELRGVLRRVAPKRRIVIVAHGSGAHVARMFAQRYPTDVAGLVLVDGQREDLERELDDAGLPSPQASPRMLSALAALARLGVLRWMRYSPLDGLSGLTLARSQAEAIQVLSRTPRVLQGIRAEVLAARASEDQVARLARRLEVPVRALVATQSLPAEGTPPEFPRETFNAIWQRVGERFGDLSDDATVELVEGDHLLHLRSPRLVVDAVVAALGTFSRA